MQRKKAAIISLSWSLGALECFCDPIPPPRHDRGRRDVRVKSWMDLSYRYQLRRIELNGYALPHEIMPEK